MKAITLTWLLVIFFVVGFLVIPQVAQYGEWAEKVALNIYAYGLIFILSVRVYIGLFGGGNSKQKAASDTECASSNEAQLSNSVNDKTLVDRIHRQAKDNPLIGFFIILCTTIIVLGNVAKSITEISEFINSW